MNTSGADNTPAGGGEILQYWGNSDAYKNTFEYMDSALIQQFGYIPAVKILIMLLILALMSLVILKIFNIRSPFKGRGITRELEQMERVRKHDLAILRANKFMAWVTNLVSQTPFVVNKASLDYWQYNITRAGIKIPGKARIMKAEEFNSIIVFIGGCCLAVNLLILVFVNVILGWILVISTIVFVSTLPMMVLRGIVREKDLEIKANFADYYLMLHYVLIANANTPLSGIMRSFAKTTSSQEMIRYIDTCIHYIDTYGEYEATRHIARDYRELPEVGKLMRLIRQANEGGNVEPELMGFRTELLKEKQYAIEKQMEKLVMRANASFNILMPILVQAILSAMSIYMTDLGVAKTLIGM